MALGYSGLVKRLVVFLPLVLAACFADQKQQLAKCQIEGQKAYPGPTLPVSDEVSRYIVLCMQAAGYDLNLTHKACPVPRPNPPFTTDPYCYRPSGAIVRLFFNLEVGK